MRSLELNLATRPFRNNTLLWLGYAVLAVAVVTFTAWNTVTFVETGRKLDELRNTVGSVENRLAAVDQRERTVDSRIGQHDLRYLTTQTARANDVILRKAFSWTRLFNVLEGVQPYEVKMTSIRPIFGSDAGAGPSLAMSEGPEVVPVNVDGIAKTVQAFFDFEDALIRDKHIDRIEPTRSTRAKNGEILFALSFLYYPDGLEKKSAPVEETTAHAAPHAEGEEPEAEAAGSEPPPDGVEDAAPAAAKPSPPPPQPNVAVPANAGAVATAPPKPSLPAASVPAAQPPSPAAGSADGVPERHYAGRGQKPLPEGPIRPKPKDWQPPDPFADKNKKKGGE